MLPEMSPKGRKLSIRARNVLSRMGIACVDDLRLTDLATVANQKNSGQVTVNEVSAFARDWHIKMRPTAADPLPLGHLGWAADLTKRELFAGMAMQGLLAADDEMCLDQNGVAIQAVAHADALLEELGKEGGEDESS